MTGVDPAATPEEPIPDEEFLGDATLRDRMLAEADSGGERGSPDGGSA